jgi:hypothetical protein
VKSLPTPGYILSIFRGLSTLVISRICAVYTIEEKRQTLWREAGLKGLKNTDRFYAIVSMESS